MDTNNILQEFLNSNIKIKSINKLKQYIQFCDDKNQNLPIKGKSSHHHILPRKLFPQFSNLKNNKWNGTHLLYSDHYYAHWLITEAIDNSSMLFAFCAMHNMDSKIGRINENDLISASEFQKKKELSNKKMTALLNQVEENGKTVAKNKGVKHSVFQNTITENGLTHAQNAGILKKANYNKHKESYKIVGEKISNHLSTVNSEGITEAQRRFRIGAKTRKSNGNGNEGSKNTAAFKAIIYNDKHEKMHECFGNINKLIKDNKLPVGLMKTYRDGTVLYENTSKRGWNAIKKEYHKYKGWYMRKVDEF